MANATWFIEPNSSDTGGAFQFFRFTNNAVEGLFFPVILLVIWVISFTTMLFSGSYMRPSAAKAWTFASFFTMILSIGLVVLDLVAPKWMYVAIVLTGIGVLWLIIEQGSE